MLGSGPITFMRWCQGMSIGSQVLISSSSRSPGRNT
ncbi:MAG: hypothetical protein OZX49_02558 [Immundisolibacter sp.]|nr:hypothetical protein [Immundisolibacter sp.]